MKGCSRQHPRNLELEEVPVAGKKSTNKLHVYVIRSVLSVPSKEKQVESPSTENELAFHGDKVCLKVQWSYFAPQMPVPSFVPHVSHRV